MAQHVRADEGLPRKRTDKLPRVPYPKRPRGSGKLAHLDEPGAEEQILERIAAGTLMVDIANELQVTPQALSLRFAHRPEYLAARAIGHQTRIDDAEKLTESAGDALELARARDIWRARSWRASVEHPDKWGDKRFLTVEHTGDLGERLRRARERVIEGAVVAEQAAALPQLADNAQDGDN